MSLIEGHDATCPHCWETIELTLDLSVLSSRISRIARSAASPMLVSFVAVDGEVAELRVEAAD